MANILLISNDDDLFSIVREAVSYEGHALYILRATETLAELIQRYRIDLALLDLTPQGAENGAMCRRVSLVVRTTQTALLALVPSNTQSVASALDAGADDCLRHATLNARELSARIRALLRRVKRTVVTAALVIYAKDRVVRLHGNPVDLTPTEYTLLEVLSQRPGEYVSANELLTQVWNYPPGNGDPALVRNHVRNLRRKLESDPDRPRVVMSAHGRGYSIGIDIQRL